LLAIPEQQIFRSLSVFAGGCQLSAIEAIMKQTGAGAVNILDGVSALLENNLLHQVDQPDDEQRLLLLEPIREYGLECLNDRRELETTRSAHAAYYLALAEETEPHLHGPDRVRWTAQLECEQENLRAALSFLLEQAHVWEGMPVGQLHAEQALR